MDVRWLLHVVYPSIFNSFSEMFPLHMLLLVWNVVISVHQLSLNLLFIIFTFSERYCYWTVLQGFQRENKTHQTWCTITFKDIHQCKWDIKDLFDHPLKLCVSTFVNPCLLCKDVVGFIVLLCSCKYKWSNTKTENIIGESKWWQAQHLSTSCRCVALLLGKYL